MQTCNPSCITESIPNVDWSKGCDITTRKGGIPYFLFFKCDPDLEFPYDPAEGSTDPWTNLENWRWAICNEHMYISPELLGQKPKGSTTTRRIASCGPEVPVSGQKTLTAQDFNSDPTDLLDFDFWDTVKRQYRFLQFGWMDCNGLVYQTTAQWSIDVDQVAEDNNDGMSFWQVDVSIAEKEIIKPILVEGLFELIANFTTANACY